MPEAGGLPSRGGRILWLARVLALAVVAGAAALYWQSGAMPVAAHRNPERPPPALGDNAAARRTALPAGGKATDAGGSAFWQTAAEAQDRGRRALAEDLSQAIGRLAGVQQAQVFLSVAERTGFGAPPGQAAVVLEPRPGAHLGRGVVDAVQRLVAGAVVNIPQDRVTVIDARSGQAWEQMPGAPLAADDDHAVRLARETQARLTEGLAGFEVVRVEVWPLGAQPDELAASHSGPPEAVAPGSEKLRWNLAARIVVPATELTRRDPQAADSPATLNRAQARLAGTVRQQASQLAPTIMPDAIAVEFEGVVDPPVAASRLTGPHAVLGLLVGAMVVGYLWGRPLAARP